MTTTVPTDDHENLDPREEQVRRLLAGARHTGPAPDDVVARMDAVLDDLRADTEPRPTAATRPVPADLAAARRRRRVRSWVLAAAAVVVIGIGVDRLADGDLGNSGADDASGGSASSAEDSGTGHDAAGAPSLAAPGASSGVVPLDRNRFGRQLERLRGELEPVPAETRAGSGSAKSEDRALRSASECGAAGPGRAVAVRYDGQPGRAVFRPVHGDTQVVDLFLCGHDGPYRSITLPAP